MEDISIFTDKTIKPTNKDLIENLDSTYELWNLILYSDLGIDFASKM